MGDQDRKSYRGYGLAAVAGLGIGAALYYFLNNRQSEQPLSNSHRDDETQRQSSLASNTTDADRRKQRSDLEEKQNEFRSRSWSLEQCTICFENILADPAHPTLQLRCGHTFHLACASPWLEKHNTCPNCRKDLNA